MLLYCILQDYIAYRFYFITFCINFAVILVQFILSILSDKPSIYQYHDEDDVRIHYLIGCN